MKYEEITDKIIKVFYKVYNTLGYGFLEKVYERAMIIEFNKMGLKYNNQYPVKVYYKEEIVGDYVADFIVEEKIIVEIKAIKELSKQDENQLLNYITSTDKEVGLLLNYGKKPEIKRKVYDNELKKYNIKSV
ncbi:MAG: GxxExxY protein [Candidatus Marinimicrobia bacterium]|nr:GxxExxY protein [Candidatus Neomarinimicrobiota bacterium]